MLGFGDASRGRGGGDGSLSVFVSDRGAFCPALVPLSKKVFSCLLVVRPLTVARPLIS